MWRDSAPDPGRAHRVAGPAHPRPRPIGPPTGIGCCRGGQGCVSREPANRTRKTAEAAPHPARRRGTRPADPAGAGSPRRREAMGRKSRPDLCGLGTEPTKPRLE